MVINSNDGLPSLIDLYRIIPTDLHISEEKNSSPTPPLVKYLSIQNAGAVQCHCTLDRVKSRPVEVLAHAHCLMQLVWVCVCSEDDML